MDYTLRWQVSVVSLRRLGPEHIDSREWICTHALAYHGRKTLHVLAEVYRFGPPSPGPRLTDRSAARLQRLDDRGNHRRVRSTTGSDRDSIDFNLDDPAIWLAYRFALPVSSRRRHYSVHHRRHKLYFVRLGMAACGFSQMTPPAKQLLRRNPCRRATEHTESSLATISATIRALSSSLHFRRRPAPVKTSSRRTGSVIAVSTVSILSPTVETEPQTRRSPRHPAGGR